MRQAPHRSPTRTERLLLSKHATWGLAVLSFTESTFLPVLIDPFLVMMTLGCRNRWLWYSIVASAASIAGGIAGYFIGALFFDLVGERIVAFYELGDELARTHALFDRNTFWVMLFGAFTPIPYKIFALVGGLLKVNFFWFVLASVIGRSARFFLVGYITYRFGRPALALFSRRMSYLTVVFLVILLIALFAL